MILMVFLYVKVDKKASEFATPNFPTNFTSSSMFYYNNNYSQVSFHLITILKTNESQ